MHQVHVHLHGGANDLIGSSIFHLFLICVNLCLPRLPNLSRAIHVSDSEAYFTGVELSFGCYSIGVKFAAATALRI